jgi:large subunit ribosomal protein L9
MKVILLDNIKGVGKKDEVINASDGYARNYLLPKKLAVEANAENMSKLNNKKEAANYRKDVEKQNAEELAKKLKGIMLKIKVKAGENGKIFGGVTAKEISENLKSQYNFDIDKKKIELKETIKTLGSFNVSVKLFEGITASVRVEVISG